MVVIVISGSLGARWVSLVYMARLNSKGYMFEVARSIQRFSHCCGSLNMNRFLFVVG